MFKTYHGLSPRIWPAAMQAKGFKTLLGASNLTSTSLKLQGRLLQDNLDSLLEQRQRRCRNWRLRVATEAIRANHRPGWPGTAQQDERIRLRPDRCHRLSRKPPPHRRGFCVIERRYRREFKSAADTLYSMGRRQPLDRK